MTSTVYALTGFVAWALFLLVLMEIMRTIWSLQDRLPPTASHPIMLRYRPS